MSYNINFYKMSLDNVNKQSSGEFYYISWMSFINVYSKMTIRLRFFLSHDFSVSTDLLLYTLSNGYSLVVSQIVLVVGYF